MRSATSRSASRLRSGHIALGLDLRLAADLDRDPLGRVDDLVDPLARLLDRTPQLRRSPAGRAGSPIDGWLAIVSSTPLDRLPKIRRGPLGVANPELGSRPMLDLGPGRPRVGHLVGDQPEALGNALRRGLSLLAVGAAAAASPLRGIGARRRGAAVAGVALGDQLRRAVDQRRQAAAVRADRLGAIGERAADAREQLGRGSATARRSRPRGVAPPPRRSGSTPAPPPRRARGSARPCSRAPPPRRQGLARRVARRLIGNRISAIGSIPSSHPARPNWSNRGERKLALRNYTRPTAADRESVRSALRNGVPGVEALSECVLP